MSDDGYVCHACTRGIHFTCTPSLCACAKRGHEELQFDGETYEHDRDYERLASQYGDVFRLMEDGRWRTPPELEEHTGHPWASISARLRDMRKQRFGAHTVNRRYVENGLYAYQLVVNLKKLS